MYAHLPEIVRKTAQIAGQSAARSPNSKVGSVSRICNKLGTIATYTKIVTIKLLWTIIVALCVRLYSELSIALSLLVGVICCGK
jgi:hypothetical protein